MTRFTRSLGYESPPIIALMIMCLPAVLVAADDKPAASTSQPADENTPAAPTTQPAATPSIIQKMPDYTGDLAHRKYLAGDWGGARTEMANKGIFLDLDVTQPLQGNAHGGRDTNNAFRYSGSTDYSLKLDTARMGLWPGGLLTLHGETKIGDNVNSKVGSLTSPNYQGLLPVPGDPGTTTLSEFYFMQALLDAPVYHVAEQGHPPYLRLEFGICLRMRVGRVGMTHVTRYAYSSAQRFGIVKDARAIHGHLLGFPGPHQDVALHVLAISVLVALDALKQACIVRRWLDVVPFLEAFWHLSGHRSLG